MLDFGALFEKLPHKESYRAAGSTSGLMLFPSKGNKQAQRALHKTAALFKVGDVRFSMMPPIQQAYKALSSKPPCSVDLSDSSRV